MEFTEVVRRRRMVRNYSPMPVERAVVDRLLRHAVHAPSAGFSQGWAFLVLDTPEDVRRFWAACTDNADATGDASAADGSTDSWLRGMMTAPVVIVPLAHKDGYLDRYAQPDKGWTDRDEARWPVPYWYVDAGMASLLILLGAVDEGLGACFFGVPDENLPGLRAEFGIPAAYRPVGAITLGHRTDDVGAEGSPARRRRKPLDEVVHRGHW